MRTCPECEREMYHWQCACGFRTPKPALAPRPAVVGVEHCPDCTRLMVGNLCRCGYRRPGTKPQLPAAPNVPLTEEQKQIGHQHCERLKALLTGGER